MSPRSDSEVKDPLWPQAYAVFREQVKYAVQRGPHPDWPEISKPIQTAIQESLTGSKPPAQAMKEAAAKVNPILAKTPF
jgi:multiple sugar transport system substrate-binding protein